MSTPVISASIHDSLLANRPDHALAEARNAVAAGAGELAARITASDLTDGQWLKLCAELAADAATASTPIDITLALEEPVRGVEAIVAAGLSPGRITLMPETLDFFVAGEMILKKQELAALTDAVKAARAASIPVGLEIFHSGGAWFVTYLQSLGLVEALDCLLPFNIAGTCWSPPQADTLRFRRSLLPPATRIGVQCGAQDAAAAKAALALCAIAIADGHGIRVGLDAWPIGADGNRFHSVAEQVAAISTLFTANCR